MIYNTPITLIMKSHLLILIMIFTQPTLVSPRFDCNTCTFCNTPNQCSVPTLNVPYYLFSGGHKSSSGSSTNIIGSHSVYCDGAFSCNDVSLLQVGGQLICSGTEACSDIETLYIHNDAYCFGGSSCSFSWLDSQNTATHTVWCGGEQSCAKASFSKMSRILAHGAYSLYNSFIFSDPNSNSLSVELFGYRAGFGATILCQTGHLCTINCYGSGCLSLHILCYGTCVVHNNSTDTITPIMGTDNINITAVTNNYTVRNDLLCSTKPTNTFDNYRERYEGENIIINVDPICCRGDESCEKIATINSLTNTHYPIVCSGNDACRVDNILNNGDIYCSGYYACYGVKNITAHSLYCGGDASCMSSTITAALEVYCTGRSSCRGTTIWSNGDLNVHLLGTNAGKNADIHCNEGHVCNIHCGGYNSCISVQLRCAGDCLVQCDTDTACPVMGTYCLDVMTCSTVYGPDIYCIGHYSCFGASIWSTTETNIHFIGDYSGLLATIYCREGHRCIIECVGSNSCMDARLQCAGECIVQCDMNTTCPIQLSLSPTATTLNPTTSAPTTFNPTTPIPITSNPTTLNPTTNEPSLFPTVTPSTSPTINPTTNPTISPSKIPTNIPTIQPTTNPTILPSDHPTLSPSKYPTISPSTNPSKSPSVNPTISPTTNPTKIPTNIPTINPTISPSQSPSNNPTTHPTIQYTATPTKM
eukprot:96141_1